MGNLYSPFAYKEQEIYGKTSAPEDVTNFQMVVQGSKALLSWTPVSDLDVLNGGNYWIRYSSDTGASWSASSTVDKYIAGNTSSFLAPLLDGVYLIKAVDSSGNESTTAATFNASTGVDILNLNAVETIIQNPQFGNNTSNTGVNNPSTSNIFYDSTAQAIQLDTTTVESGTHDEFYNSGTNTDVVDTYNSTQNSILDDNSGANYTAYIAENIFDGASGNFDARSGNFDDTVHTSNKLTDENASFDSSWNGNIVRNITDGTTAAVTAVDSATVLSLDSDIFDGTSEDYRLEVQENILRDLTVNFTTASTTLIGRTVRLDSGGTATISSVDSATQCTLSTDLMLDGHGEDYEIEWGPYQIFDSTGPFTSAVVGKTIRNTTEGTSATVSALVSAYELTLDTAIFDNEDGDSYTIEVDSNILRDTAGVFDSDSANRIIRNLDTGVQTTVSSVDSSTEITLVDDIFPSDGANYKIEGDVQSSATYYFTDDYIDLGQVYTSRLLTKFSTNSFDVINLFDATGANFDSRTGLFDGTDISSTNAEVQVRTTNHDPSGSPVWNSWVKFYIGDYTARAFQFRTILTSSNTTQNIRCTELSVEIDMPDTIKRGYSVLTDSGTNNGTKVITYTSPFKTTPTVNITITSASDNSIYHTISNSTNTGFTVTFYDNSTSQSSQETFNWISVGY